MTVDMIYADKLLGDVKKCCLMVLFHVQTEKTNLKWWTFLKKSGKNNYYLTSGIVNNAYLKNRISLLWNFSELWRRLSLIWIFSQFLKLLWFIKFYSIQDIKLKKSREITRSFEWKLPIFGRRRGRYHPILRARQTLKGFKRFKEIKFVYSC